MIPGRLTVSQPMIHFRAGATTGAAHLFWLAKGSHRADRVDVQQRVANGYVWGHFIIDGVEGYAALHDEAQTTTLSTFIANEVLPDVADNRAVLLSLFTWMRLGGGNAVTFAEQMLAVMGVEELPDGGEM